MDVGRIDGVNEPSMNQPRQQEKRQRPTDAVRPNDEVSISPEARKAAEVSRLASLTKQLPDTRADKVAEASARIESENTQDRNVNRTVAHRMLEDLL